MPDAPINSPVLTQDLKDALRRCVVFARDHGFSVDDAIRSFFEEHFTKEVPKGAGDPSAEIRIQEGVARLTEVVKDLIAPKSDDI